MAAHAGARIEERPEAIRRLCRGWRGNPELLEECVAELEVLLFLEGDVAEICEKESCVTGSTDVAAPACIASYGSALEKSLAGRVTASTRFKSASERSVRFVGRLTPAARATGRPASVAQKAAQRKTRRAGLCGISEFGPLGFGSGPPF
ncbi:hypothetical protein AJ87_03610 [Rhizobium yanglingense]|nr:hypothetical protein AJ87_03610 [Rhizobium yanglingense]